MIRVNDENTDCQAGMSVADLLKKQGMESAMVAVWMDDRIIPRSQYEETLIHGDASIQIVLIASGG